MAAAAAAAGRRARPPVRAPAESSASSSPACARGAEGLGVRDPPPHAASAPLAAPVRRPRRSRGGPAGRPRRVSGRAAAGRRAGAALSPGPGVGRRVPGRRRPPSPAAGPGRGVLAVRSPTRRRLPPPARPGVGGQGEENPPRHGPAATGFRLAGARRRGGGRVGRVPTPTALDPRARAPRSFSSRYLARPGAEV